jgi:hypothetical protein
MLWNRRLTSESITDSINSSVEASIKALMDAHIIPLKQTLKEQQKQIDEQKEMISPTDVLRCLVCRVWCFEVAGRSSGLSGVRLLLGLPGVSSVFSDGNSDCLWFISTSTFGLFTFVGLYH